MKCASNPIPGLSLLFLHHPYMLLLGIQWIFHLLVSLQLRDVEEMIEILDSDAFDFRFDVGVCQPSSSIRLIDLPSIIELFVSHSTVISVKAQLDQIAEGLEAARILYLFKKNPKRMGELLMYEEKKVTSDMLVALFEPMFSARGHNNREAEEAAVMYWSFSMLKVRYCL